MLGGQYLHARATPSAGRYTLHSVYTVSVSAQGKIELCRLEVGCAPGTGNSKRSKGSKAMSKRRPWQLALRAVWQSASLVLGNLEAALREETRPSAARGDEAMVLNSGVRAVIGTYRVRLFARLEPVSVRERESTGSLCLPPPHRHDRQRHLERPQPVRLKHAGPVRHPGHHQRHHGLDRQHHSTAFGPREARDGWLNREQTLARAEKTEAALIKRSHGAQ